MKQWWDITEEDQKAIMENTEWCMADNGYFRGGGYSSRYETRAQMPATMIRLNLVKGLGPVLQIAEGWTVALPEEVSDKLWKTYRTIHGHVHGLLQDAMAKKDRSRQLMM